METVTDFIFSSVLAREGAGCGSVGDVPGAWLASAPPSRQGLTPRGILKCNPEFPAFPGEEH